MPQNIVTSITQAKKNIENVNIELDNIFWVNISKNNLIKYGLFKTQVLTLEEKELIEKKSHFNKILEKASNYIYIRPRSIKELHQYLEIKKGIDVNIINQIIQTLQEKSLLSDQNFTKWYIKNRLDFGIHGWNKIKSELLKKGISRNIIESEVSVHKSLIINDEEFDTRSQRIKQYILKVSQTIKAKTQQDKLNKITRRLLSKGFSYDEIKNQIKELKNIDF